MSLSSRTKNKLIDTINTTFASIGVANGMKMPRSSVNNEGAAWDLLIAKHLMSLAKKRVDAAEKAAILDGVINDAEHNPKPPGTRELCFNGDIVQIALEVRNPSARVDVDGLLATLMLKGVKPELIAECVKIATKKTRAAHVFTPMWVSTD